MKQIFIIVFAILLSSPVSAQTSKTSKTKTRSTVTQKTGTGKKTTSTKTSKKTKSANKKTNTVNKTNKTVYTNSSIKGLEKQRSQIQQKIREQEQALKANQADVKQRLQNLMVLNSAIEERQKNIETIQKDITHIDGDIDILKAQLSTLQDQLKDRKLKYIKSMRYMARYRKVQDKLMFVFSAKNFSEMFRRMRFVRQYADYQRAQGDLVKSKQDQVNEKYQQLETVKGQKNALLSKGKKERIALEGQQDEQKKMVSSLQQQQKSIQGIIAEQHKKDAALNAQIDRLIAIEVEKARARAEAEAKRKAAAEAAAKKRADELARKKAAAEAAAKENARRIAEAKEREAKAKAEARAAALEAEKARREDAREANLRAAAERKARAEQAAREAETQRLAAERKAAAEAERSEREIAEATKVNEEGMRMSTVDRMLSGGFEANKGRLPMPITGKYKVVSHFGQYAVEGLRNVTLDNKGINIMGSPGCMARSIYDGEVSAVFSFSGTMVVMVRHGSYISVYCNLKSVGVNKGQKVSTGQVLGSVGTDNVLQFQLRKETSKLNPEAWLRR